jgi:glycerophosphoryl diester phosphodiesterase
MLINANSKDLGKPENVVIAHRGAWKNTGAPQNSLASLKAAISMGCAASEFDIHMTRDSFLIITHDPEYAGINVQQNNYVDLKPHVLKNGELLPLLQDFLKTGMQQRKTRLVLEIKPSVIGKDWAMATTQKVVDVVHKLGAKPWCLYISFDYSICKRIKELDPGAQVQYLGGTKTVGELYNDGISGLDYHYRVFEKDNELITLAKAKGLTTNAWTVNTDSLMRYFIKKDIDFITTDEPELLFSILNEYKGN